MSQAMVAVEQKETGLTAYRDIFNRVNAIEMRQTQIEDDFWQGGQALQPVESKAFYIYPDSRKPARLTDKVFPLFSLPLLNLVRWGQDRVTDLKTLVFKPTVDRYQIALSLRQARRDRETMNVMRVQSHIARLNRQLARSIRANDDLCVYRVGAYTNNNVVLAFTLADYFSTISGNVYPAAAVADIDKHQVVVQIKIL